MKQSGRRGLALVCAGALFLSARAFAQPQPPGKGDYDGDGAITSFDARFVLRAAVGLESCDPGDQFSRCDVDCDGSLSAEDARYILRAAVGLTDIQTLEDVASAPLPEEPPAAPRYPLSATGYEIREYDGVTYVGGVLIANKTYGLPRSYGPGDLTDETYAAFLAMQRDAAMQGLSLWIASGYRSYDMQSAIYNRYVGRDGRAYADRYSARPGYSEHQTGLAFDLNTISQSFAYTAEGRWVAENCYRYGFILRYPQEKEAVTGYMYEPWHLRYLGEDLAARVYESGLCLEEYLGVTSAYR